MRAVGRILYALLMVWAVAISFLFVVNLIFGYPRPVTVADLPLYAVALLLVIRWWRKRRSARRAPTTAFEGGDEP